MYGVVEATNLPSPMVHLDLATHLNHRAFGDGADVDGFGQHYLPKHNEPSTLVVSGGLLSFANPFSRDQGASTLDNICIQDNNKPHIVYEFSNSTSSSLGGLYILASSSHGPVIANVKVIYQDSSSSVSQIVVPDWQQEKDLNQVEKWDWIARPISNSNTLGGLYSIPVYLDPARTVISIEMALPSQLQSSSPSSPPRNNNGAVDPTSAAAAAAVHSSPSRKDDPFAPSIHLFAITALSTPTTSTTANTNHALTRGSAIQMTAARASRRFWNEDTALIPVLLIRLHNVGTLWLDNVTLSVSSTVGPAVETVYPGKLDHLAPGHVSSLDIGIRVNGANDDAPTDLHVQIKTLQGAILLEQTVGILLSSPTAYQTTKR